MLKSIALSLTALALMAGCSTTPTTNTERAVTTEQSEKEVPVPAVSQQKSTVVSVEANGNKRTDGTYQSRQSDAEGSRASVQVSSEKSNANGDTSKHNKVLKVASDGTEMGYSQDDKSVAVTGSNVTKDFTVDGQDVAISGNGNTLNFKGATHGLSVTGNDNHIQVENAVMVDVTGQNNQVTYSGSKPEITKAGEGNLVNSL